MGYVARHCLRTPKQSKKKLIRKQNKTGGGGSWELITLTSGLSGALKIFLELCFIDVVSANCLELRGIGHFPHLGPRNRRQKAESSGQHPRDQAGIRSWASLSLSFPVAVCVGRVKKECSHTAFSRGEGGRESRCFPW